MFAVIGTRPVRAQSTMAPLSDTTSVIESVPHLSADGSVLAWHASTYQAIDRAPPLRVDLLAECAGESRVRSAPTGNSGIDRYLLAQQVPSLSADGSRVASLRYEGADEPYVYYETWIWPRSTPVLFEPDPVMTHPTAFPYNHYAIDGLGSSPLPVPHLSGDGRTIWQAYHKTGELPGSMMLEFGADIDVDPAHCFLQLLPGIMQPTISRDGSTIVGVIVAADTSAEIQRWTRVGPSWCGSAPETMTIGTFSSLTVDFFSDLTVSDDGKHVAWSSRWSENHCSPGTPTPSPDVWLWSEAGDPAWPGMTTCLVPPPGVGRLARIPLREQLGIESNASLDAAGRRLAFMSNGDQDLGRNPNHRPSLFVMDLQAPSPLAIQLSETLPPTTGTVGNSNYRAPQVLGYHMSTNGEVAAYTVSESPTTSDPWSDGDIKLVNVVTASAGTSTDPNPIPADEPFEVTVTACQVFGDTVEATLSLRQWSSQGRKLVVASWVEDSGQRIPASPLVQSMSGGQAVELRVAVTMPSTPVNPTCFANAWDGSAAHPDVQQARLP